MAKTYPERLHQDILEDPKRGGERKVFKALSNLSEKYRVFYSVHWESINGHWGIVEGEADFILLHPDWGALVIEVKGGGIRYNAEKDQWQSQDKQGEIHDIKDPVKQASKSFHELIGRINSIPEWGKKYLNMAPAVCFPDIHIPKGQFFKTDLLRELTFDRDDLDNLESAVIKAFQVLFHAPNSNGAPGIEGTRIIEKILANSFEIRTPLGTKLDRDEDRLIQLTEEQFGALSLLGNRKRVAIAGCAGSGKTMLAVRKAQEFAQKGMNVLLTCFNAALADDLQQRLEDINVYNFHKLCTAAGDQYGYSEKSRIADVDYFDRILPETLMNASNEIGRVYDAVIVDEGQDFKENFFLALEPLLKEDGYLYIFYDNNQNIFGNPNNFYGLIPEAPFTLTRNCRNTQAIHRKVIRFHSDPDGLQCVGPEGEPPEVVEYQGSEGLLTVLRKLLHRLVNEEHIDCEDIIIITPRSSEKTCLATGTKIGNFTLSAAADQVHFQVQVTNIHRFKGLERKVVILAEIDERAARDSDMVFYVGCSRARTYLIILHDAQTPKEILDRLQSPT